MDEKPRHALTDLHSPEQRDTLEGQRVGFIIPSHLQQQLCSRPAVETLCTAEVLSYNSSTALILSSSS